MPRASLAVVIATLSIFLSGVIDCAAAEPIRVLFLGDEGHHRPRERHEQLAPVLKARGVELTYTDELTDLSAKTLDGYDALLIYANAVEIKPDQEAALLDYVAKGRGLVALHCASYCFLNSPKYIELVGAQFLRHGTGTFRTQIARPDHELMKGFDGFESWDETYVHAKHNEAERIVLEYREEKETKEPWTWVRTHGKGRVFYTAWGHDERTWAQPGFHNLVERGILWAVKRDPQTAGAFSDRRRMTAQRTDVKPFEYVPANVPFYPAGEKWGTLADPITKMQRPLSAEESLKHYVVPVGFELRLFVAEPQIGKPIAMTWDERGRLWLAETVDYPNELQPAGKGRDRIRICEDTDGDGRADKFTVFADKLSIPTSILRVGNGLIIHQAPDTLLLSDTDGDDVADKRQVLFTGWGTNDTHAGPSNLHYGHDNWIYGIVGYSGFNGTVGGERLSFRSGFYRFKPDGSKLEFLRNTNNNSWGVGLNEEGVLFGSTANGNPSEYMPIANRHYEAVRGWSSTVLQGIAGDPKWQAATKNIRQVDHHGGFTAAAGHALYTARNYPQAYWNRIAFVTEPTAHLVATFRIDALGAGYRSRLDGNLVASDDEWAAPIMAEVGPDGNVWILDWYNFIVQHNPTPRGFETGRGNAYETDLRDKKHGRIYRLVQTNDPRTKDKSISLRSTTPQKLVETLRSDNLFWRKQAQRLLVERGQSDVVPQLIKLLEDQSVDAVGINGGAIHAIWTLAGLGALDDAKSDAAKAVAAALDHPSAGVRRAAVMTLPCDSHYAVEIAERVNDRDGQVRLAAMLALAESDVAAKADVVAAFMDPSVVNDRWLLDAATTLAARQDAVFLLALSQRGTEAKLGSAARERVTIVAESFARGKPAQVDGLIEALSQASPANAEAIIAGWLKGWPKDSAPKLSDSAETSLGKLFAKLLPSGRAQLVSLADRWQTTSLRKYAREIAATFEKTVQDNNATDEARIDAAAQLIEFQKQDAASVESLLELIGPRTSPALAKGLLEAAGKSESAAAGASIVAKLGVVTPNVRPVAVRVLLSKTEWTLAMMDGVEQGTLQFSDLALDQRQALAAHPDKAISSRAKKLLAAGGGLPNADRQKVLDELLPLTKQPGDAVAGKVVFKAQCAKCHVHSGEGSKIGPELTGMAVHPKHELLTHIIDPSRSVEGNFRVYSVLTDDGRAFNGLLASETKNAVELVDAEGKRHQLLRENIEEIVASPKSLMPEGFEQQVKGQDLVNLLEFLTQKGKYVPIPLDKVANVVTTRGMFYSADADLERLVLSDWSPKTIEGIPFALVDPQGEAKPNGIMLYGPSGYLAPKMPKSVELPCHTTAKAIHLLSGISGWGYPASGKGSTSMVVRLRYADGKTEDHKLVNGEHFADYIRRVDVPGSKFAFAARGQQVRYLSVVPARQEAIETIELVKGSDGSAPLVMAVTIETPQP